MIVVGITGGLASGKSEVTKIFKKIGAMVFDADQAAKAAVKKGKPAYRAIIKIFGPGYLGKNKEIDRKKLARYVFDHPGALHKLNILIHPTVIFDCLNVIEKFRGKRGILALDVPLLFESKMESLGDFTVVVSSKETLLLKRAARKGIPKDLARKILASQWPLKKKEKLADFVVRNNGSPKDLEKQVREIFGKLKQGGNA